MIRRRALAPLVLAFALVLVVPTAAAIAKPVPKVKPAVEGKKLASQYLSLLKGKATPALKAFLSDGFLIQRADGTSADKKTYLSGTVTNIKTFTISGVQATLTGDVLVVRYTATTDQIVEGKEYKKDPAPRLSTFLWTGKTWQLVSHANFNTPVAT
jgi:hypothetical protein